MIGGMFFCVCDHCKARGEEYATMPSCRECGDQVCQGCGVDYDAETNRITCSHCTEEQPA